MYASNALAMPGSSQKTTIQALATTSLGGYNCVRNGYTFVHPQKVDRAVSGGTAGTVITDATLMAFYGTTAASLGSDLTDFQCCYRLEWTSAGATSDCSAAVNILTTAQLGKVIENRVIYSGATTAASSNLVADLNPQSILTWNLDFLLAAQWQLST